MLVKFSSVAHKLFDSGALATLAIYAVAIEYDGVV